MPLELAIVDTWLERKLPRRSMNYLRLVTRYARLVMNDARLVMCDARLVICDARLVMRYPRLVMGYPRLVMRYPRLTVDLERYPERLRATQCLEILGLTCLVLGSVFAVLDNVWPATKMTSGSARAQTLIPDILTLAGAASSFIGVMVYIGEYDVIVKTPGVSYGYSMVLSLLASLLAGGAAILIFIGNRMQPAGVQDVRL
nr:hypothetical protein BaRGS_004034 [Batillaria attramentaria]